MHYDTIIGARDLAAAGPAPDWVVIDCRFDLGDPAWGEYVYHRGHIPGAFFAHLDRDLCGAAARGTGRHPLPDWSRFAARLGPWGIRPATQVIVYDQRNGSYADRLWRMPAAPSACGANRSPSTRWQGAPRGGAHVWLRRHRLPQPAGHGARRPDRFAPVCGLLERVDR